MNPGTLFSVYSLTPAHQRLKDPPLVAVLGMDPNPFRLVGVADNHGPLIERAADLGLQGGFLAQIAARQHFERQRLGKQDFARGQGIIDLVGQMTLDGPDLVLGYAPKYRASSETGLGGWSDQTIVENPDHWEADHCIDAHAVPGVIFSNRGLNNFPHPSYADIPAMTIGKELSARISSGPVGSDEDQDALEERLKGLGYL